MLSQRNVKFFLIINRPVKMSPYLLGYCDGWEYTTSDLVVLPSKVELKEYEMGWDDGYGDRSVIWEAYGHELERLDTISVARQFELTLLCQKRLDTT